MEGHPLYFILESVPTELPLDVLTREVLTILSSNMSNEEIQSPLLDLLTYEVVGTNILEDIIGHRDIYVEYYTDNILPYLSNDQKVESVSSEGSSNKTSPVCIDEVANVSADAYSTLFLTSEFFSLSYIPYRPSKCALSPAALVPVARLPERFAQIFAGDITHFNRLQSECFDTIFNSSANVLLCAPTGAGKTNCALLAILRVFHQAASPAPSEKNAAKVKVDQDLSSHAVGFSDDPRHNSVSPSQPLVVYLTPMKALASEITEKLSHKLKRLGLSVFECTGDESPPYSLLRTVSVLICTPEKWDVMTRKPVGDSSLIQRQALLVIDEVHLLGVRGRGPVLESIVIRTFQHIESTQQPLRIVGISATVPNYADVAEFLRAPPEGILVFGSDYRPVPLAPLIFGVKDCKRVSEERANIILRQNTNQPKTGKANYSIAEANNFICELTENGGNGPQATAKHRRPRLMVDDSEEKRAIMQKSEGIISHQGNSRVLSPVVGGAVQAEAKIRERIANSKASSSRRQDRMQKEGKPLCDIPLKGLSNRDIMDELTISLVHNEVLNHQSQVLVFVHSRNGTVTMARKIADMMDELLSIHAIPTPDSPASTLRSVQTTGGGELAQYLARGVGFHNAGMTKDHRRTVEKLFLAGHISVVCCTATLAWGVNLPCSTVIIHGTEIMTQSGNSKATVRDIDILDVQQILGRCGRPQFTSKGEVGRGILLSTIDKAPEFVRLLNNETSIESSMLESLSDILNAEIVLGNICTLSDCTNFISRSFLATRIKRLPRKYNAVIERRECDGQTVEQINLPETFRNIALAAIQDLVNARIVTCDSSTGALYPTELGRICSYYYIGHRNLEAFFALLRESVNGFVTHADLLSCVCSCQDFATFRLRPTEIEEVSSLSGDRFEYMNFSLQDSLLKNKKLDRKAVAKFKEAYAYKDNGPPCRLAIQNNVDIDSAGYKTNVLLQCFISRKEIRLDSLLTDQRLMLSVAPRLLRAFSEIALVLQRASESFKLLDLVNSLEYQVWFDTALPLWAIVRAPVGSIIAGQGRFQTSLAALPRRRVGEIMTEDTLHKFELHKSAKNVSSLEVLLDLSFEDVDLILNHKVASNMFRRALSYVPRLNLECTVTPVSSRILRLNINATVGFVWKKAIHGEVLDMWIVVHALETNAVLRYEKLTITEETRHKAHDVVFMLRVSGWKKSSLGKSVRGYEEYMRELDYDDEPDVQALDTEAFREQGRFFNAEAISPASLAVTVMPDSWAGSSLTRIVYPVSLKSQLSTSVLDYKVADDGSICYTRLNNDATARFSDSSLSFTPIPCIPPLPLCVLHWPAAEDYFSRRFSFFNILQSTMLHKLYHSNDNVLVGCPTGSGKSAMAELAMLQSLRRCGDQVKVIYIAPLKALVREKYDEWKKPLKQHLGVNVIEITGESLPTSQSLHRANLILTTPEKFDAISRHWRQREYVALISLLIIDEAHLIGTGRGYVLESIVSRLRYLDELYHERPQKNLRIIGLSTASANCGDVARWLGISDLGNIFNFSPAARPVKLEAHIQEYPGSAYASRMNTMNRPIYNAIKKYSPRLPLLIFTSSRRQTRRTAQALISLAAGDEAAPRCIRKYPSEEFASRVQDADCSFCLSYGIGLHHAGMPQSDRRAIEDLYSAGKITIVIATATLAWGLNFPAYMTIVKGCEYYDGTIKSYIDYDITELLQLTGRAGRPQYIANRFRDKFEEVFGTRVYDHLVDIGVLNTVYLISSNGVIMDKPNVARAISAYAQTTGTSALDYDTSLELLRGVEHQQLTEPQAVTVVLCKRGMKSFYKQFFTEPFPFESSMLTTSMASPLMAALMKHQSPKKTSGNQLLAPASTHFPEILNAEVASFGVRSVAELRAWIRYSFFFVRARRNPLYYQIDIQMKYEALSDILSRIRTGDIVPTKMSLRSRDNPLGKSLLDLEVEYRLYKGLLDSSSVLSDKSKFILLESSMEGPQTPRLILPYATEFELRDMLIIGEIYQCIDDTLMMLEEQGLMLGFSTFENALREIESTADVDTSSTVKHSALYTDLDFEYPDCFYIPTLLGDIVSRYYIFYSSGAILHSWCTGVNLLVPSNEPSVTTDEVSAATDEVKPIIHISTVSCASSTAPVTSNSLYASEGMVDSLAYLEMLVACQEFMAIPIRHCEDEDMVLMYTRLLAQAKRPFEGGCIRYPPRPGTTSSDQAYKAFLLLQAHFCKATPRGLFDFPASDYLLDLDACLQNAIRLSVAATEIALSYKAPLRYALAAIHTSQALVQGLWSDMDPLLSLIELRNVYKTYIRACSKLSPGEMQQLLTFRGLAKLFHEEGPNVFRACLQKTGVFSKKALSSLDIKLRSIPNMALSASAVANLSSKAKGPKNAGPVTLTLDVSFAHTSVVGSSVVPAHFRSSIFHKSKPHTYFIILCEAEAPYNVLTAHRLSGVSSASSHTFIIHFRPTIRICLVPDTFLGLDSIVDVDLTTVTSSSRTKVL